jgi:hypothetical protein
MAEPRKVTLHFDEQYMADLMSEELCTDGPLSDLRVETVTQKEDGGFVIVMAVKKAEAEK